MNDIELEEYDNSFIFHNEVLIRFNIPSLISQRPDVDTKSIITGDNSNLVSLGWKINDESFFENLMN